MTTYRTTVPSPVGPLLLTSNGAALTGLWLPGGRDALRRPTDAIEAVEAPGPFTEVVTQLEAYFAGELTVFDVPLAAAGTPFQQRVWDQLSRIPYATTISYGQLAMRVGNPNASRAVGLANGRNPISIIVPCHRVIGANGKLTGYGGGLPTKQWLLELERQRATPTLLPTADLSAR